MNNLVVNITYKDAKGKTTEVRQFLLSQYVDMIKKETLKSINDIEDVFCKQLEGGKHKEEWSAEHMKQFQQIRHELLDVANSVKRIPDSIAMKLDIPSDEYIAGIIDVNKFSVEKKD